LCGPLTAGAGDPQLYDDREAGAPLVRFAFCKREEVLREAAQRLRRM
jgi:aspartate/methionine/tyrosine aminotransferase